MKQTAFNCVEWIVIDGGSCDGTLELIQEYSSNIAYWVSEHDGGIYEAMNKGIAKAKGEYILFLNSGDALCSTEIIAKVLDDGHFGKCDYLTGDVYYTLNGKEIGVGRSPARLTGGAIFRTPLSHPASFIRRSRLVALGGYDCSYRIAADSKLFFYDLILLNASYARLDFFVTFFDQSGVSSVNTELTGKEVKRYFSELLPPRIIEDYQHLVFGKTLLEKLLVRLTRHSLRYKIITFVTGILYLPTSLRNRSRLLLKKISRRK